MGSEVPDKFRGACGAAEWMSRQLQRFSCMCMDLYLSLAT